MSWYVLAFFGSIPVLLAAAFRWGEWPEKAGTSIHAAAAVGTLMMRLLSPVRYNHLEAALLLIDVATLCAFATLALKANRWWPLWVTSLHLISVLSHQARLVNDELWPAAYAMMETLPAFVIAIVLGIAIWNERRHHMRNAVPS